jgi:hypothetical protein
MTSAKSVAAQFEPATYPLTLTYAGTGKGTANLAGASWASCTASGCTANVTNGATVQLTGVANAGSTFKGWGVSCTGTGICSIKMNAAKSVTATFSSP